MGLAAQADIAAGGSILEKLYNEVKGSPAVKNVEVAGVDTLAAALETTAAAYLPTPFGPVAKAVIATAAQNLIAAIEAQQSTPAAPATAPAPSTVTVVTPS